jgi:hypothetical protein
VQLINKVLIALTGWTRRDDGVSIATALTGLVLFLHHITGDVLTETKWKALLDRKSDLCHIRFKFIELSRKVNVEIIILI